MSATEMTLLVLRLVVAAVLARAAIGKLLDRDAAHDGARALGVPARLAEPVAIALPIAELALALGVLVTPVAGPAGIVAALLLAAFSALIGANLARGRRPACNCFGATAEPISALTLVRNLVLTVIAGLLGVAYLGDRSLGAYGGLSDVQAIGLAAGVCLALLGALTALVLTHLIRQNGRLLERIEALEQQQPGRHRHTPPRRKAAVPIGSPAPALQTTTLDDQPVALPDLLDGTLPAVLLFVETRCGACVALGDELALREEPFTDRRLLVVAHGTRADVIAKFGSIRHAEILLDTTGATSEAYGVFGTPSAVVVTPDGRIASPIAEGRFDCKRLLDRSSATTEDRALEVLA